MATEVWRWQVSKIYIFLIIASSYLPYMLVFILFLAIPAGYVQTFFIFRCRGGVEYDIAV